MLAHKGEPTFTNKVKCQLVMYTWELTLTLACRQCKQITYYKC